MSLKTTATALRNAPALLMFGLFAALPASAQVLIVEDVTTTGGSSIVAVDRIHQDTACRVVGVISILDREEGAEAAFAEAGIPFESLLTRSDIVAL